MAIQPIGPATISFRRDIPQVNVYDPATHELVPLAPDTPATALARAVLAGNDAAIPALLDAALERWHRPDYCPWEQPIHTTACPKHGGMMSECPTRTNLRAVEFTNESWGFPTHARSYHGAEPFILIPPAYPNPPEGTP